MWRARVRAGSLALALLGAATSARAECTKDLDCAGEQICEAGRCTASAPAAATPAAATPAAPTPAAPTPASTTPVGATSPPAAPVQPPHAVAPARVITVESAPVPEPARLERRSQALVVVGSLAAVAGSVGLVVGLRSMENACHRDLADDFKVEHCQPDYMAYALGGAALLGGVTMVVIGAQKVPVAPLARVTPWLSPRAGGLTLRLEL